MANRKADNPPRAESPEHPIANRIRRLPTSPGCYLFKDGAGTVIYVGKAQSLRHRVASYFQPGRPHHAKTDALVAATDDLEFIATDNEIEALVLENNLIKSNRPRYNVLLKDDKNFPYLKLTTGERYPRLAIARRARKDGHIYFGPYLPASAAHRMMRIIHRLYRLRPCSEKLNGRRERPCLYYQIDQCLAPCVASICGREHYLEAIEQSRLLLAGKDRDVAARLKEMMETAASELRYEEAASLRDLLKALGSAAVRQKAATLSLDDHDAVGMWRLGPNLSLQILKRRRGLLNRREEITFSAPETTGDEAGLLQEMLKQYYAHRTDIPPEILLPQKLPEQDLIESWAKSRRGGTVHLTIPSRGIKRRLVEMAQENARLALLSRDTTAGLAELARLLGLPAPPLRIEGFDNSNIQGSSPVAACVVFEEGRPRRSAYRRFRIKTVQGADDFATMTEVVLRRYQRLLDEKRPLPDLILIDGGRGQLGAARKALAKLRISRLPMLGLAKRDEEIHLLDRPEPVNLPRSSEALKILIRVRDEAHRFAVAYHRKRRRKVRLRSRLQDIPGIGKTRSRILLRRFGSLSGVLQASREDLSKVIGQKLADRILATAKMSN